MPRKRITITCLSLTLMLSGCISMQPEVPEADPGIGQPWNQPESGSVDRPQDGSSLAELADTGWRQFFTDSRLVEVIGLALENNRDLRAAVLNVERARAQYRIQRADKLPSIGASGYLTRQGGNGQSNVEIYTAELGLASYEVDLFGRVASLSEAALNRYLATEEAQASLRLSLIAEVANAWMTLAADIETQQLTRSTLSLYKEELALTRRRYELGAVSSLDLNQALTIVANAKAEIALYDGQVAQDLSALNLLVGTPVGKELIPDRFSPAVAGPGKLHSGMHSEILLRRPDIRQAERQLLAANANIGAARAAFFPSITLVGSFGTTSVELDGLFSSGTDVWSFMPAINIPIFQGGRLRANRDVAYADRDMALLEYEQAIQQGFKEASDALILSRTLANRRAALEDLVTAAGDTYSLSKVRYRAGRDSYFILLDSQRTLYSAQRSLIEAELSEQSNLINLYKALGGGWKEAS